MSIEPGSSPSSTQRAAGETRGADNDRPADRPRETPPREAVDRFRQLMQHGRQEGRAAPLEREALPRAPIEAGRNPAHAAPPSEADTGVHAQPGLSGRQDSVDNNGFGANSLDGADLLAMMQAQSALRDAGVSPQASTPAPSTAGGKALAELLERHVRQFAVDGATATARDGHVLLRMSDATLPGTDLLLSRTGDGWHLRADVRSRESYDAIREAAPALARRFAEHNLGKLEIDPHFDA